ncbi:TetR/AcrR family transcriptional regulator [Vibrio salinus]|uniref:TetR/AcrR family transcriptional regulator n=1 Tax=Vibrio salinus TaxID=2899784 RepID=UPI001E605000|nr:TetR/AcrR family transcriptional regulator [Vibrio salinus]MCE0495703.1 TetR/AcrR family transcriptional regulator [Vibrio salinus]
MRLAKYDREQVLCSALSLFVTKGFNKTSMQDIKKATGLHPGSIYCAFKNKQGLLLAAIEHYVNERDQQFSDIFDSQPTIIKGLKSYFSMIVNECENATIKDCLLQKLMNELTQDDNEMKNIINDALNSWKSKLLSKLREAQAKGEISAESDCDFLAEYLVMGIYGLREFSHTKPQKGLLAKIADQLLQSTIQ